MAYCEGMNCRAPATKVLINNKGFIHLFCNTCYKRVSKLWNWHDVPNKKEREKVLRKQKGYCQKNVREGTFIVYQGSK